MSDYIPFNITTDSGKTLWRKINATSGSSTWGPLGESIEAIEAEAKAKAWEEGLEAKFKLLEGQDSVSLDNPYLQGEKIILSNNDYDQLRKALDKE